MVVLVVLVLFQLALGDNVDNNITELTNNLNSKNFLHFNSSF